MTFGIKPFSEPVLGYSQLDSMEQNSVKLLVEIWTFSFQDNAFENVWKMAAIKSRPQVLNQLSQFSRGPIGNSAAFVQVVA